MSEKSIAEKVVGMMYAGDGFSKWLGIEVVSVSPGRCELRMKVRKEMLNGFAIAHGGITYSLADSALAFASNGYGKKCVSVETSVSHTVAVREGEELTAVAEEVSLSEKIGVYYITVKNHPGKTVALFKGTVYRTGREWEV